MNVQGKGEGWAQMQEQSIREALTGRDHRSEEDPVAELMRWLVVRGKTPSVTAAALPGLVGLVGGVLEAMNVRAVRRWQVAEAVHGLDGDQQGHREDGPAEFTPAEWDAFAQSLRRGDFDGSR